MRTAPLASRCPRCGRGYPVAAGHCPDDGARLVALEPAAAEHDPDADLRIGTTVAGDFQIRKVIGAGAMGRVYRAHQRSVDRDVAIKILHRELSANPDIVRRFHREAKIANQLRHPHAVDIHAAGQLPDGALYIVMEFLDGVSLAELLSANPEGLPVARAIAILLQTCDVVGEAHARGIIHRDLKPENVMLIQRAQVADWVKILDFGIAKATIDEASMQTAAGLVFGTARYISPEGAEGHEVGPASDVYSLATMLYQMLVGHTPFDGGGTLGLLVRRVHEDAPPLAQSPRGASVPRHLTNVVMTNLARDPSRRAPNAHALGQALAHAAQADGVDVAASDAPARPSHFAAHAKLAIAPTLDDAAAQPVIAPPSPPSASVEPAAPPTVEGSSRRPKVALVVLALLLGAALSALLVERLTAHGEDPRAAHVAKVRRALAEEHYIAPPGDNVRELTEQGLARWPEDAELVHLRGEAVHELLTRAIAARASGEATRAREYAMQARLLEPSNETVRLLLTSDAGTTQPDAARTSPTRAR